METLLASIGLLLAAIYMLVLSRDLARYFPGCFVTGLSVASMLFGASGFLLLLVGFLP